MQDDELAECWGMITELWPRASIGAAEAEIWRQKMRQVDPADLKQAIGDAYAGGESRPRLADLLARCRSLSERRELPLRGLQKAEEIRRVLEEDDLAMQVLARAIGDIDPMEMPWCLERAAPNLPTVLRPNWQVPGSLRYRMALERIAIWFSGRGREELADHRKFLAVSRPQDQEAIGCKRL